MKKNQLHPRTASINLKQKNDSRQSRQKALAWLVERFPKAFDTTEQIFPLSIGIIKDVLSYSDEAAAMGISKAKLREALVVFTRRMDYLASLKAQGLRINLHGEPCGEVTEEEAQLAAQKIKKCIEKSIKNQRKVCIEVPARQNFYVETTEPVLRKPEIVFKTKSSKALDPSAVERLKSKLGLQKKEELID